MTAEIPGDLRGPRLRVLPHRPDGRIPLPRRLLAHLRRWKRRGQTFTVEWNGRAVKDCDKAFRHVAEAAGLPDVTPHIIRHTCATWLAQSGAPTWESAGFLGMTEKQSEETYGHHHPDHLRGPRIG